MGEIADMMLDGTLCEGCGVFIGTGAGYPVRCEDCGGDGCEGFADQKQRSQDKRASNRENSARLLHQAGVRFDMKNDGAHLIVRSNPIVDFWPGTGKYIQRGTNKQGRGVFNLLKLIGVEAPKDRT